ncbi:MAG: hypothetical protein II838_13545 [Lachnospiraceae bacterium]|nr:hypothetical protein [Lachnospiraceae bacterium]
MIKSLLRKFIYKFNQIDTQDKNIRSVIRRQYLEDKILHCCDSGITSEKYCDKKIIVSLTSFGRRVNSVCYAIESLMQQVKKANRIVLWLGEKDYNGLIPYSLRKQEERGLEIRRTKDIRSYTKIIPSLKEFPDDVIITIDDDIMYDFDVIGNLIASYQKNPKGIHACRCHIIKYKSNGDIMPYNKWQWSSFDAQNNFNNFFTGVGGVLYPPNSFDSEVFNEKVFLDICKTADDVWLNAMARKKGTMIVKVPTKNALGEDYVELQDVQDMALNTVNVASSHNDVQLQKVWAKYSL